MGANQSQQPSAIQALPAHSSLLESTFQPAFDYDKDSCYPVPAIGLDGTVNPGMALDGDVSQGCRDAARLANTNSYSRARCNGDWCGVVYTLYFEKDQVSWGPGSAGHRHDWEHIVVWIKVDRSSDLAGMRSSLEYVATSAHGKFTIHKRDNLRFDDGAKNHAKVVYHKDGGTTHAFRKAEAHDDPPENHRGTWQYPPLVGWDGYPPGLRDIISKADYGKANFAVKDDRFAANLAKAMPSGINFKPDGVDEFVWEPEAGELRRAAAEEPPRAEPATAEERDEL